MEGEIDFIARYDQRNKKAYIEYPDGVKEYFS